MAVIKKHQDGKCDGCGEVETVVCVLLHCMRCEEERSCGDIGINEYMHSGTILGEGDQQGRKLSSSQLQRVCIPGFRTGWR